MARGKYIVIEGSDGTGKSTQVERLAARLREKGIPILKVYNSDTKRMEPIREPGGVETANELRHIIVNKKLERDPWTNVMLFTANRRLNWLQAVKPALDAGEWVICSRNWISTVAYQGYGEGIDIGKIADFTRENIGEEYMNPDLVLILTLDDHGVRRERIGNRGQLKNPDTFESMPDEFQDKMQDGFTKFAKENGIETIDASKTREEIEEIIWQRVTDLL